MIKLIVSGVWICVITLASVYFSMQMAAAPKVDEEAAARKAALELVTGSVTTVPVIGDGEVKGYFLVRLAYTANKEMAAKQTVPVADMITDELYTMLAGQKVIDISDAGSFDVDGFRTTVKEGLNKRFKEEIIDEVFIEQIDYLTKTELHEPATKTPKTIVKGEVPAKESAAEGGH
ncbi:hypothetical protein [Sinorhizobium sp. BG8]|uniref:hypothetical protein n=1 Tax=Sinorhizobium sp. BG8 TaxID=2613773 RepID=UPI00193CF39B|nr:hypothetical protein [Sinorhizobium sp. BG8]QRM54259.1 hypothetical protein F3Y30_06600 [Sinorhizobium sp. BG8]